MAPLTTPSWPSRRAISMLMNELWRPERATKTVALGDELPGAVADLDHDARPQIQSPVVRRGHVEHAMGTAEVVHVLQRPPKRDPELTRAGPGLLERDRDGRLQQQARIPGMGTERRGGTPSVRDFVAAGEHGETGRRG